MDVDNNVLLPCCELQFGDGSAGHSDGSVVASFDASSAPATAAPAATTTEPGDAVLVVSELGPVSRPRLRRNATGSGKQQAAAGRDSRRSAAWAWRISSACSVAATRCASSRPWRPTQLRRGTRRWSRRSWPMARRGCAGTSPPAGSGSSSSRRRRMRAASGRGSRCSAGWGWRSSSGYGAVASRCMSSWPWPSGMAPATRCSTTTTCRYLPRVRIGLDRERTGSKDKLGGRRCRGCTGRRGNRELDDDAGGLTGSI